MKTTTKIGLLPYMWKTWKKMPSALRTGLVVVALLVLVARVLGNGDESEA